MKTQYDTATSLDGFVVSQARQLHLVLALALAFAGCLKPDCGNEVREEMVSPDGACKVVIFSRNCGATTGFNCQASILPAANKLPDEVGNAFIFDSGEAKVAWVDSKTLSVSMDGSARAFKQEQRVQGVRLVYSMATETRNSEEEHKANPQARPIGAGKIPEFAGCQRRLLFILARLGTAGASWAAILSPWPSESDSTTSPNTATTARSNCRRTSSGCGLVSTPGRRCWPTR